MPRQRAGVVVDHFDTPTVPPARGRPSDPRASLASGGIGVLTGVLAAIITSFAIAIAVIWLTNLLQK